MQTTDYERIEKAIRYIETNFRRQPGLEEIARATGLGAYHFQRLFTRWAGISPKRFLQFLSAEYARDLLRESSSVLEVAYEAGLSGSGRLHDLTVNVYALTPGEIRMQGADVTIRYGVHSSPFGDCFVASTDRGVCALSFPAEDGVGTAVEELRQQWKKAILVEDAKNAKELATRIFFPTPRKNNPLPNVVVQGTNFQIRVWEALIRIPPGRAASYEDIAARIGAPDAVRAVGNAVARNPVAFLIPCHRVIRKSGVFGNYRWGPARKLAMLGWEGAKFR